MLRWIGDVWRCAREPIRRGSLGSHASETGLIIGMIIYCRLIILAFGVAIGAAIFAVAKLYS